MFAAAESGMMSCGVWLLCCGGFFSSAALNTTDSVHYFLECEKDPQKDSSRFSQRNVLAPSLFYFLVLIDIEDRERVVRCLAVDRHGNVIK